MYGIDTPITFTFNIEPMVTAPATISIAKVDPNKENTYDLDGTTIGAIYVPPTDVLAGSYTFTDTFAIAGLWSIYLGDGVAASYTMLSSSQILIEASQTTFIQDVNFNPI